jgi:5-formyltetrahydrofolate cyclo-ligase
VSRRPRKRRTSKRGTPQQGKRRVATLRRPCTKKRPSARPKKSVAPKRTAKKRAARTRRPKARIATSTKPALRVKVRAQRLRLSPEERRLAAERVLARLAGTRLFLVSRRIACYLPNDGEVDTSDLIERMWRLRKKVFLPVLSRLALDRLWFARALPGMQLVPNRYGIPEPRVAARDLVRAREIDLILLPLVAFDNNGNRLGRGAGFYDRSLAFLRQRRFLRTPRLLGLAYDFQRVPKIDADPWDVPLDGIVTDRSAYYPEH